MFDRDDLAHLRLLWAGGLPASVLYTNGVGLDRQARGRGAKSLCGPASRFVSATEEFEQGRSVQPRVSA
jgi:hypothetical protein